MPDNGSDAAIIQGDKVTIFLGGKPFVFSEPSRRKARIMRSEWIAAIMPTIDSLPADVRGRVLSGKMEKADIDPININSASATNALVIAENMLQYLIRHVPGLSECPSVTDEASDVEIGKAFESVSILVNRAYEKKTDGAAILTTNGSKVAPTS